MVFKSFLSMCVVFFQCNSWGSDSEEPNSIPFKLGWELQESHRMCPWAISQLAIQKKKLFSLYIHSKSMEGLDVLHTNTRKLWHAVIDGGDIEFVFPPFTNKKEKLVQKSIETMMMVGEFLTKRNLALSFDENELMEALETRNAFIGRGGFELKIAQTIKILRPDEKDYFEIWKAWVKKHVNYQNKTEEELENIWILNPNAALPNLTILFGQYDANKQVSPITFNKWFLQIENLIKNTDLYLKKANFYDQVKNQTIELVTKLNFEPQFTIQYPLESLIPLIFSLYRNNLSFKEGIYTNLIRALPNYNKLKSQEFNGFSKVEGLIFLHALTLWGIASSADHSTLIQQCYTDLENKGQVDAKRNLYFMSRRPFSHMWAEIQQETNGSFSEIYKKIMAENTLFSRKFFKKDVEDNLIWNSDLNLNYGEQFTTEDGKDVRNLFYMRECFSQEFLAELDANDSLEMNIKKLLEKGVITPSMLACFDPEKAVVTFLDGSTGKPQDILMRFFEKSLETVEKPGSYYIFHFNENLLNIQEIQCNYDSLSPPFLLNQLDSMGFIKELINLIYGEAIVEFRKASKITLNQSNNTLFMTNMMSEGDFAAQTEVLKSEILELFKFLRQKTKENLNVQFFTSMIKTIECNED